MKLRKTNLEALLSTETVEIVTDEEGNKELVIAEHIFGEQRPVDHAVLVELAEMLAATRDVVFRFTFDPAGEYPWAGGIFSWHDKLPMPESEEEAEKLKGTAVRKFTGRWLADEPEIPVFDHDMPNLLCQLVTALAEFFDDAYNPTTEA